MKHSLILRDALITWQFQRINSWSWDKHPKSKLNINPSLTGMESDVSSYIKINGGKSEALITEEIAWDGRKYYPVHSHTKCHCLCPDSTRKYFWQQKARDWTSTKRECQDNPVNPNQCLANLKSYPHTASFSFHLQQQCLFLLSLCLIWLD